MNQTKTFTLMEKTKSNGYTEYKEIHYCSYCGNRAKQKDMGSSHNHRWEEHIIYFCECENALKETKIKKEIQEHKEKVRKLEYELQELEKLENNEVINTMKFNNELKKLKLKFNIKESKN